MSQVLERGYKLVKSSYPLQCLYISPSFTLLSSLSFIYNYFKTHLPSPTVNTGLFILGNLRLVPECLSSLPCPNHPPPFNSILYHKHLWGFWGCLLEGNAHWLIDYEKTLHFMHNIFYQVDIYIAGAEGYGSTVLKSSFLPSLRICYSGLC